MNKAKEPKQISQKALVRIFEDIKRLGTQDVRFCFLIGSGASINSGIPSGWELSNRWYHELKDELEPSDIQAWEKKTGTSFEAENIGAFYPFLYEKRYESAPQVGYEEFKALMADKEPSIGYSILAQILAKERHNFVITTNFDYLIEDAVRIYTSKKPFSAGHETLAEFISLQTDRPTIIKVHRDLFLHPFNDRDGTSKLKEEWKKALSPILANFNLLVIGYGGNDGSLMEYLQDIDPKIRKPIYWCTKGPVVLNTKISKLLVQDDFQVEIQGFDELMYALYQPLKYDLFDRLEEPDDHPLVKAAKEKLEKFKANINDLIAKQKDSPESLDNLKPIVHGSSKYLIEAYEEGDMSKREQIFKKAIKEYPSDAFLLSHYASLLLKTGRFDKGIKLYKEATGMKPDDDRIFYNWGVVLSDLAETKSGEEAENLLNQAIQKYEVATKLNPLDSEAFNNWGTVLRDLAHAKPQEGFENLLKQAIAKYETAIKLNPAYSDAFNNWGTTLSDLAKTKPPEEAENLINLAIQKYEIATKLNPAYSGVFNNWGNVLSDLANSKSSEEAENLINLAIQKYEIATKLNPLYSEAFNNWGNVLSDLANSKSSEEAENLINLAIQKYEIATKLNPLYSEAFNNWGNVLSDLANSKPPEEAENLINLAIQKYEIATKLNPLYSEAFNNWGNVLSDLANSKSSEEAENLINLAIQKYEIATKLNPLYSEAFNNWGNVLSDLANSKPPEEAENLINLAIQKYEIAAKLNPGDLEAFYNWGIALSDLAKIKPGEEYERNLEQAESILQKAISLGASSYGLACVYALRSNTKEALKYLSISLSKQEIDPEFVLEDSDWDNYKENKQFKALIKKYSKS